MGVGASPFFYAKNVISDDSRMAHSTMLDTMQKYNVIPRCIRCIKYGSIDDATTMLRMIL